MSIYGTLEYIDRQQRHSDLTEIAAILNREKYEINAKSNSLRMSFKVQIQISELFVKYQKEAFRFESDEI